jgi:hypothetical protein
MHVKIDNDRSIDVKGLFVVQKEAGDRVVTPMMQWWMDMSLYKGPLLEIVVKECKSIDIHFEIGG